ncbi:MAG: hypothetical protein IKA64_04245 [Clostridia bacterium]|nr:hypothetical protein [Clostridia bacterium]
MISFLDVDGVGEHKLYLEGLRLKYSILEKSIPGIRGLDYRALRSLPLSRRDRADVLELYSEIFLHNVYFSSFSPKSGLPSPYIRCIYGSEAAFLNLFYREAISLSFGFVALCSAGDGVKILGSRNYEQILELGEPIIALDLFEHAYFKDFGFRKADYVKTALSHFDLSLIDKHFSCK